MEGHPSGWVWQSQEIFVVSDTAEEEHAFPNSCGALRDEWFAPSRMVPLTTAQRRLGAMGFGRLIPQRITDTNCNSWSA